MSDHGPHSAECAHADGGVCHCDCHGALHGIAHTGRGRGSKLTRHMSNVTVTKRDHGGGYTVIDHATGKPPGGGVKSDRRPGGPLARMADVTVAAKRHELSGDTRAKVDRVRAALPASREEWMRPVDRRPQAIAELRRREAEQGARRGQLQTELDRRTAGGQTWAQTLDLRQQILDLDNELALYPSKIHYYEASPHFDPHYPTAKDGQRIAPDEWERHLDGVLDAGRSVLAEHKTARDADPEYAHLTAAWREAEAEAEAETARHALDNAGSIDDFTAARRRVAAAKERLNAAKAARNARDQRILMDMLGSHRGFGGIPHDTAEVRAPEQVGATGEHVAGPPRSDYEQVLRRAEGFFPKDWLRASRNRGMLRIGSSPRAFHNDEVDGRSLLTMPDEAQKDDYVGGHGLGGQAGAVDVTVHEMGHRMEGTIPGLRQLEMTFMKRRARRRNGTREKAQPIPGYADKTEVAYFDDWAHKYAGKSYEAYGGNNPGELAWEVFQVGLQDLYSRAYRFDNGDDLQAFTIGALLTLG